MTNPASILAAVVAAQGGSEIARYEQAAPQPTPKKEPRAERRRKEKAARKQCQKHERKRK